MCTSRDCQGIMSGMTAIYIYIYIYIIYIYIYMVIPTLGIGLRALFLTEARQQSKGVRKATKGWNTHGKEVFRTSWRLMLVGILFSVCYCCCGAAVWVLAFVVLLFLLCSTQLVLLFVLRIISTVRTEANCAHTYGDTKKGGKQHEWYLNTRLKNWIQKLGTLNRKLY